MEMEITLDEVIINFVRNNECLYDKKDINFKNNSKKKEIWHNISESLKNLYDINMTADAVETRWTSLRDMFSREKRKQQLPPSGSGYTATKEWELYKTMLFLSPYIEHRRTKTSLPVLTGQSSCSTQSETARNNFSSFNEHEIVSISDGTVDHDDNCSEDVNDYYIQKENEAPATIYNNMFKPHWFKPLCSILNDTDRLPLSSPLSTNSKAQSVERPVLKHVTKSVPELDDFAKRRKKKDEQLEKELIEASSAISTTMRNVSSFICSEKKNENGYMLAMQEALNYVPDINKTQCLIEVLQVIKKYEQRQ